MRLVWILVDPAQPRLRGLRVPAFSLAARGVPGGRILEETVDRGCSIGRALPTRMAA